jgi:hypothetical protein
LDTYNKEGNTLTKVDPKATFSSSKISGGTRVKYEVTEQTDQAIKGIYKKAEKADFWGVDGSLLASSVKDYITNSFKDKGLKTPSGLNVTNSSDETTITAGGITVSSEDESESGWLVFIMNLY